MKELKSQFANALLVVLTVAAVVAAFINFQQNFQESKRFRLPQDGVTWVDRSQADGSNRVIALDVTPDSPADKRGIKAGDRLLAIHNVPVESATDVPEILVGIGIYGNARYHVERQGRDFRPTLILAVREVDWSVTYQYLVGAAYLIIGLFVYLRRGNAPKSLHFLILCMASFVLSTFHYTGKLNNFDKIMYWGNVAAGFFAPAIFLHFCLSFPVVRPWMRGRGRTLLLYVPGSVLLAVMVLVAQGILVMDISPIELRWILDRLQMGYISALYLLGAYFLNRQYRRSEDPIVRQQIKWLRNGAVLGILPFTILHAVPYMLGVVNAWYMKLAVFSLPLIPLTWAYAIVRYRLMDVDVIFQQGYAYTLATLAVLGVFYGVFFGLGRFEDLGPGAAFVMILIAAFIFQPIRNWIQETLDRYVFYKDRYDYRRTLIEFARELSSETDLDKMLDSVADRLIRTLSVQHVAFFIAGENGTFQLQKSHGRRDPLYEEGLDLSFLPAEPRGHLFFEQTKHALDIVSREMPARVRHTIAELDLTYYMPCTVRGRTIAYIGISRTEEGDFLSSDDLELLVTLAGYVGIAIENARLYHSLQRKVGEYERLKEFSENIVESIHVGILAADLEDRVDSWNTQLEMLTCIPRSIAVGRSLAELFPPELVEKFDSVRGETGIHNIYKFTYRPIGNLIAQAERAAAGGNGSGNNGGPLHEADREMTLNIAIAPLVSKDFRQIGRLIIFDDITERSELEARLVQADKLSSIGMLAAGVAHEVNTPLAVISTYAQMLAKQVTDDDPKSRLLEKIAKQTFRASEIVNSLLNFSRTSKSDIDDVDLNRVISDTISLVGHQLQKAGVTARLELAPDLPVIRGNANKLQQVFLNLTLNARDAMEAGGTLAIRSWAEGETVRVDVSDTGQGIAPEHLARIYDPFFTTKQTRKGTGLGLSVTYGIVQEHGGSIDVQSEPGAGTLFHLEFPLERKPQAVNA
ncbi:MAG TPA: ATP-binding protein [Bryobacteraceae bacterium]|nr:ATP-binding protein [Bryobacteraceae bacterium]